MAELTKYIEVRSNGEAIVGMENHHEQVTTYPSRVLESAIIYGLEKPWQSQYLHPRLRLGKPDNKINPGLKQAIWHGKPTARINQVSTCKPLS